MATGQKLSSPEDWSPPIPEAERMRGLELEDIYSSAQIDFMKRLFHGSKANGNPAHAAEMRNKEMKNRTENSASGSAHRFSPNEENVDVRQQELLKEVGLLEKYLDRPIVKEFIHVAKHLDDDFVELLLVEARHRARIPEFLEFVSGLNSPPAKYETSPRNVRLPEFIQSEWIDKGFKPEEIDRQMLKAYDEKLVRAIENYEYNNGLLDESLRFKKVGNKRSRKEMTLSKD